MLACAGQFCARLPVVLILALCACGSSSKAPESAASVMPLDDRPSNTSTNTSSADTHTPSPEVSRAMKLIEAQKFAEAKDVLSRAAATDSKDVLAQYYLGVACGGMKDTDGALVAYNRAIQLDPRFAEAYVNLSALQLDLKDASGALATTDVGLKNANSPDLYLNRALALEALGKKDEVVAAYGAAVKQMQDNLSLRVRYAQLLADSGKKEEALAQLRRVRDGDDPKLLALAAILARELGAYAECVAVLDHAISIKDLAALRVRRGMCREDLKDDAGAKTDYERAIAMEAKFAPAHYYYGEMLRKAKDQKKACAEFALAIEYGGTQGIGPQAKRASSDFGCR